MVSSRVRPLVIIKLRSDYKTLLSSPSPNLPQDVDLSCLSAHELNDDEYQSHHLSSQISKSKSTVSTFIILEKKQSSKIGMRFRISVDNKNP